MADALRGSMDAAEYKHVVLGLIFLKSPTRRTRTSTAQRTSAGCRARRVPVRQRRGQQGGEFYAPRYVNYCDHARRCPDAIRSLRVIDALLTTPDREEALSRVYARAMAAGAGYVTADCDFDRDGVDLRIHAGGAMRPAIDLQLKATVNLTESENGYSIPIEAPQLRSAHCNPWRQTPRILFVLDLPADESRWITITPDELVLRRRAYWINLKGCEESDNQSSVTVRIPMRNVLTSRPCSR